MIDQNQVDAWLSEFVAKLKNAFGERLKFIGHIGSWARGEPRPESDIDCLVVLDKIELEDIKRYRDTISTMPDAATLGGGILVSTEELDQTPPFHLVQLFFNGCRVLYGSVEGTLTKPGFEDYITDVRLKVCDNLHIARHLLLFSQNLSGLANGLKNEFQTCFFALENWVFATQGKFVERKDEILDYLDDPDDKEVVRVARDWYTLADDLAARPAHYIELLERWARGMITRLGRYTCD